MACQHRRDLLDPLTDAGRHSDAARQELRKAERSEGLQRLVAPVDGIVRYSDIVRGQHLEHM